MTGESCYKVPGLDEIRAMIALCERHMERCERGPLTLKELDQRSALIRALLYEIVGTAPNDSQELARGVGLYWRFSRWVIA